MSSSPFHGIFSAFSEAQESERARPTKMSREEEEVGDFSDDSTASHSSSGIQPGRLAVDIYEQDDYYIIKAALAGVRMSDVDIEVDGNVVTIRGERRQTDNVPKNQYYLQECYWGSFSRSVTLPTAVDAKKIRATFNKDCILKVLIPREERVKIVRISEA